MSNSKLEYLTNEYAVHGPPGSSAASTYMVGRLFPSSAWPSKHLRGIPAPRVHRLRS
jgi:hypothetical protein